MQPPSENGASQPIVIRRATVDDARAIADVHVRSWQWGYRGLMPDDYLDSLSVDRRAEAHTHRISHEGEERTWVALQGDTIVGFATSGPGRDSDALPGSSELSAIYLREEVTGTGVGQALLAQTVDDVRQRGYTHMTLWVLETNKRARRFYEKNGWAPDGTSKTDERAPGVVFHQVRYRRRLVS